MSERCPTIEEHALRIAAAAPPLSDEQQATLSRLFAYRGMGGRRRSTAA